jgi:2-oxoglutarate dehydrogenase complex dehydrogenase (E1) component-like enzyme
LRQTDAKVSFDALDEGTSFTPIWQYRPIVHDITKIVLIGCGKIIHEARAELKNKPHVAILSLEELLPFPEKRLLELLKEADRDNVKVL